jgi:leucyl/phenylalanyl-tRNA---protein transferase
MAIDLEILLRAYAGGYFPMSDARDDPEIFWVEPKQRAILPLEGLHISKSLAKAVRQDCFRVTSDTAFADVIARCAESAEDRDDTWINQDIEDAFVALHQFGHAHSIECWQDGEGEPKLVGGLYGLALGRAFFGESMFSRATDASKVALVWLVARLRLGGFQLLDCQFITNHLSSLGAIEISQAEYLNKLGPALSPLDGPLTNNQFAGASASSSPDSSRCADWFALDGFLGAVPSAGLASAVSSDLGAGVSSSPGKLILHSLTQTS